MGVDDQMGVLSLSQFVLGAGRRLVPLSRPVPPNAPVHARRPASGGFNKINLK
jgi:hypothetical protein